MQVIVLLSAGFTGAVLAADQPEFSADMTMQAGEQAMAGKIYATRDKMRYEMPMAVTITRLDRKVSYILMPEQQMYMEQPIDSTALAKAGAIGQGELERVPLGKERVDGRDTDKFLVTYSDTSTKGSMKVYQWIDAQGVPIKVAAEDGTWTVFYRNVSVAPQPAGLFEIPAGYTSMQMPSIPGSGNTVPDTGNDASSADDLMKQVQQMAKSAAGDSADPQGNN